MISERFAQGDSLLHRADSRVKIISTTLLTIIVATSDNATALLVALIAAVFLTALARLPLLPLVRRLAAANLFFAFLWLTLPLTGGGEHMVHLGPLTLSGEGIDLAYRITLKGNAVLLLITALLGTATIVDIGHALQQMGIPDKLTLLILTSYRYLILIEQEYQRLRRAANVRCFTPASTLHTYRTYSYLLGMTIVRSHERSRRVYNAMCMRGFNGIMPSLALRSRLQRVDILFLLAFTGAGIALVLVGFFC